MRKALMYLNLYGCEAVWRKRKNSLKTQFLNNIGWATSMPFASINPTNQRTNPWNFDNIFLRIGDFEKLSFFESAILKMKKNENQSKLLGYQGWVKILMITLVYSKRVSSRNNLLHSVYGQIVTSIWNLRPETSILNEI